MNTANKIYDISANETKEISGGMAALPEAAALFLDTAFQLTIVSFCAIMSKKYLPQNDRGTGLGAIISVFAGLTAFWGVPQISKNVSIASSGKVENKQP